MGPTFILGSLDLNDGVNTTIVGDWPDTSTPGKITATVLIRGTSNTQVAYIAGQVQTAINSAYTLAGVSQALPLITDLYATGYPLTFDVTGGSIVPTKRHPNATLYTITLECLPLARSEPFTVSGFGTLSSTNAAVLIPGIPGTAPALLHIELTDTTSSGSHINRVRVAAAPRDQAYTHATDYQPWLDGGNTTPDATAIGGGYTRLTTTSLSHTQMTTMAPAAGAQYRGLRDGYLRVRGSGTVVGTPASLTASVDAATTTTTTTTHMESTQTPSARVASGVVTRTGVGSMTVTGTGITPGSTLIVAIAVAPDESAPTQYPGYATVSSGWNQVLGGQFMMWNSAETYMMAANSYLMIRQSTATTESITITAATAALAGDLSVGNVQAVMYEINDVAPLFNVDTWGKVAEKFYGSADVYDLSKASDNNFTGAPIGETTTPNQIVLRIAIGAPFDAAPVGFWYDDPTIVYNANGFALAYSIQDDPGTPRVRAVANYNLSTHPHESDPDSQFGGGTSFILYGLSIRTNITTVAESSITYDEPTPGELFTGSYVARVQAIDAAGYRGNATGSTTATVSVKRSAITWSWTAVPNAVAYAIAIQYGTATYETIVTDTSYTLTTLTGLGRVSGLPLTTGAVAPMPFVRARIGTAGDSTLTEVPEVAVPSGTFSMARLFAYRLLPPIDAGLDGWQNGLIAIDARSANGESATVDVDALWHVPSREPQAIVETPDLALVSPSTFVIESNRDASATVGWLADVVGDEIGRLRSTGCVVGFPGDTILTFNVDCEGGVHDTSATFEVSVKVWPRHRLDSWGGA